METIKLATEGSTELEMVKGASSDYVLSKDEVHKLFVVDRIGCPIDAIRLTKDVQGAEVSGTDATLAKVDSKTTALTILANAADGHVLKFYVEATTLGGIRGYKEYKVSFSANKAPEFKAEIPKITVDVDANDLSEPTFTYTSPSAADAEADAILMEFSGLAALPCLCAEVL